MTYILGINGFHADASAALIKDGKILNAAEEERFLRVKHWSGFPIKTIKWILEENSISIEEIDHIAINTNPNAHFFRKLFYISKTRPNLKFLIDRWSNKQKRLDIKYFLKEAFPGGRIKAKFHFIEHHLSHLSSAFYASDFEDASILSIDGFGDFASSASAFGKGKEIKIFKQDFFPHSMGVFYTAITQFLGFPHYGDEYKVMGLAPYGEDEFNNEMNELVKIFDNGKYKLNLDYFVHATQKIPYQWDNTAPVVGQYYSKNLENLLGPSRKKTDPLTQRHKNIAKSAQLMYEKCLFNILKKLHKIRPSDYLCIAGGCGANSVANGKITKNTPYKKVFIQAAAGDAGTALGAAYYVSIAISNKRPTPMGAAYLGTIFNNNEIEELLSKKKVKEKINSEKCKIIKFDKEEKLLDFVCREIITGKVIGWYQGKMEWGPRALGNRSIIADPRRSDMKKILNLKIKKRESFRPFAPSILKEFVSEWFEISSKDDWDVPYMMKVYKIRREKQKLIPSVCHVDGTGRLQSVTKKLNNRYYNLINKFYTITNVPMLLNTSFNENEPIVSTPREALNCFLRTKMDILVLENSLIIRT